MNKIYINALWMITEKVFSIFGVIFVTAFVAKYIGPDNFGKLAFTTSIFAIIQTFSLYGSENIIFQKTSKNILMGQKIIESTKNTRNLFYSTLSIITIAYIYYTFDTLTFIFSIATCMSIYFALHDVYTIYFNAILKAQINTICNVIGLLISLIVRYMIPLFELDVRWLCIPIILVTAVPFFLRKKIYNSIKINGYLYSKKYSQKMLHLGNKLVLYSLSVAIFTKSSQILLGIYSKYDLGIYSVALTLGTSFYFIFNALISSLMTRIYNESNQEESQIQISRLYIIIIIISFIMYLIFKFTGEYLIIKLYGDKFKEVTLILPLIILVTLFSGLNTVAEKYLYKFNAYDFLKNKTIVLAIFNITISYILIKNYLMLGAVYSMLITEIVSFTIFNYFYKNGIILKTQLKIFKFKTYKNLLK